MIISLSAASMTFFRGDGLAARALRSTVWTASSYIVSQVIRFGSNLILTRLLFPEAFGLMALVTVVMVGLTAFSDAGTTAAILQNRRGDDPAFLDTIWTIQVIRGVVLWLLAAVLAVPLAVFYQEPMLASVLPLSGFTFVLMGFYPTKMQTANRHLVLGRMTLLEIFSYVVSVVVLVVFAWATGSIWALVAGNILDAALKLILVSIIIEGHRNRFHWDPSAVRELWRFGAWIFPSTACTFLLSQGDRLILGKYLSLEMLGIYNIGYFLASFPILFAAAITTKILIPIYREVLPGGNTAHQARLQGMRFVLTGLFVSGLLLIALLGLPLVVLLYDVRYAEAGAIVVLLSCMQLPYAIGMTYDQAALAAGDSRRYFNLLICRASLFLICFFIGVETAGLFGALLGQGIACVLVYPLNIRMARHYGVWDARHDAVYLGISGLGAILALTLHWNAVGSLAS